MISLNSLNNDLEMARAIAARVREAGGSAYFVGGYVRDLLLGMENKDIIPVLILCE